MSVILAIDFGTQRIGLAISRGSLAEPLKVIANSPQSFLQVRTLCNQEKVEQIVVGISENEMANKTKQFAAALQQYLQLPLDFFDETLSSHQAHQQLQSAPKAKRSQPIDHFAAANFLQEYLDALPG